MKKFLLLLALAFVFSACSPEGNATGVPNVPSEPESSFSENSGPEDAENLIIEQVISSAEYSIKKYSENSYKIENMGIFEEVTNLSVSEDGYLTFDLTLQKGQQKVTENFTGFWLYASSYDPNINWGGYCLADENTLAVCGLDKVVLINLESFCLIDIEFEFPETEGTDLWINGVAFDEELGWLVAAGEAFYGQEHKNAMPLHIFSFDKDGKFIKEYYADAFASYGGWLDYSTPSLSWNNGVIRLDGKTYLSCGSRSYCLEDGSAYSGSSIQEPYGAEIGEYSLFFYHCYSIDSESKPWLGSSFQQTDLGYYAVLKDLDGNILDFFSTGESYIPGEGEEPLKVTHHGGLSFTIENPYLAKSMDLDFENSTYSVEYNYTDKHLGNLLDTSSDGAYSLYEAAVQGGGEAYFYEVALKNNKTGEITHIAPNGTNIGTFSSEGFLKNGDFYVFSSSGLKIYDPETAEVVFDIEDNFSLENRILYTFRRDPNDFSYIVVYAEYTSEELNEGYSSEDYPYIMPFTIKIGYLDSEGRLLEFFESGVNARADFFGLEYLEMRYSKDELLIVTSGGKGFDGRQFTFDRKTETFSNAKPAE